MPSNDFIPVNDAAVYLASAVGIEKAIEVITAAAESLGMDPNKLNQKSMLAVFESIASKPGLLGIAARFAKSRVIMSSLNVRDKEG